MRSMTGSCNSLREAGLLAQLPIYLQSLGNVATLRGEFATADSLIAEADAIAEATGTRLAPLRGRASRRLSGEEKPRPPR